MTTLEQVKSAYTAFEQNPLDSNFLKQFHLVFNQYVIEQDDNQKMINYVHCDDPDGPIFTQSIEDELPDWAVVIENNK